MRGSHLIKLYAIAVKEVTTQIINGFADRSGDAAAVKLLKTCYLEHLETVSPAQIIKNSIAATPKHGKTVDEDMVRTVVLRRLGACVEYGQAFRKAVADDSLSGDIELPFYVRGFLQTVNDRFLDYLRAASQLVLRRFRENGQLNYYRPEDIVLRANARLREPKA